ncbi:hypothetical protein HY772_07430 [Candidatus Woesearchaeota archaeon]|nr:hypothetical protein [Candidatus Woesearchaeota archaeon]
MEKGGICSVCLFLIYLLISLPLIASVVSADSFSVNIHGVDEVAGFRKSNDVTIINASVNIAGDVLIDSSQVKLVTDPTRAFSCIPLPDSSASCFMTIPQILAGGVYPFQFQAFHDDLTPSSAVASAQVVVDDSPAKPVGLEISLKGTTVNVTVGALDQACATCPPTACSGIEKIAYLSNNAQLKEQSLKTSQCVVGASSTMFNISVGKTTENRTLCVEVYDRLDQKSSECKIVTIDGSPPSLVNMSVWKGESLLSFSSGKPETVKIRAIIKDDSGIDANSMVADFSIINQIPQFNQQYKAIDNSTQYKNIYEGCKPTAKKGLVECVWNNLVMVLPAEIEPQVRLAFNDLNGNLPAAIYTLPVKFDNAAPKVLKIRSQSVDNAGKNWVGRYNNTITADIEETGSGLTKRGIVLDVAGFGSQLTNIGQVTTLFPNNCSVGWSCVWNGVNVTSSKPKNGDVLTVTIVYPSQDDAGNAVEGNTISAMYLDLAAPSIVNITGSQVCPVAGEDIKLIVNVSEKESGDVKATVSASALSLDHFPREFECEKTSEDGKWLCEIAIGNLPTYYAKDFVNITISDLAGNKNSTVFPQEVCESAPGIPPNVVGVSKVDIFPRNGVDKMVAERISFPLFFQPFFTTAGTVTKIQKVSVVGCEITGGTVNDPYVVTEFLVDKPLISTKVLFMPEAFKNASGAGALGDKAKMNCSTRLIVRSGTKVFKEPEIENVMFDVPLHGTLFGEITKTVKAKIDAKQREIDATQESIDSLQKWVNILGTMCTVAEILAKLVAALDLLYVVIWGVSWALELTGILAGVGQGLYHGACQFMSYVTGYGVPTFWQTNMALNLPNSLESPAASSPGFWLKLICAFVSCRLLETSNAFELIANTGSADGGDYAEFVANDKATTPGRPNRIDVSKDKPTGKTGDVTESVIGFSGPDLLSPYRSLPVATRLFCSPGELYGLKKERQVKCMTRNCYRDFVTAGFSPAICDRMEELRTCLYVDGAAYRIVGDAGVVMRYMTGILEYWLTQFLATLGSVFLAKFTRCPWPLGLAQSGEISAKIQMPYMCTSPTVSSGWVSAYCSGAMAGLLYLDVGDWLGGSDFKWNYYNKKLEDPDYCVL